MPPATKALRSIRDVDPPENRTLGWAVLEWTAEYLIQPDGPNAGEPWEYTDEQVGIVLRWYQIDGNGKFAFRRGVLRRMKGWGKDPFLASIGATELCGPCRFDGWDADGRPVSVQHPAPWIQVAAVNLDQTHNTMRLFPGMFSKQAVDDYKIDLGKQIIYARGAGQIEAVTSSPRALEGGRGTLVIANETHHWIASNEGLAMMEVIKRNLAKSRDGAARVMEITNAHLPGERSAAEDTYDAWKQADGKLVGVYYDSLEAPPVKDLMDLPAVREAITVARGDSTWLDVDRLADEIADPTTPEWMSRRFYLNQVVAVDVERWLPEGAWGACAQVREIDGGAKVVLGFDGSFSSDSTALVVASMERDPDIKPHVAQVGLWEKPLDKPTWRAPRLDIMETIRQACKRWRVVEIAVDPHIWVSEMEQLLEEGFPVVEFRQSGSPMIEATQRFYEMVCNGKITHSPSPDFDRHIANAHTKTDSRGSRLVKDSTNSAHKIDLAVAGVMALDRACAVKPITARFISMNDI